MIKKILGVIAVLIVVLFVVVAMQPPTFKISRSATLPAPPEKVFAQVNDFHKWEAWSPWAKMDPNSKSTFEGPQAGKGSSFAWAGNNDVGEGKMTIAESKPNELILIDMQFIKPFEGKSVTEFTFTPKGSETVVTWSMSGTNNFLGKAIGLVMSCDKMVGPQFEKGLENMKATVQAAP